MTTTARALRRIALSLSLLVPAAGPALAAPAAGDIIAVPLAPIVPEAQRQCTEKTASGLGTRILRAGTGPKAGKEDYALVGYIGYLAQTGAVFDQNPGAALPVNGLIPGFTEGLLLMPRGSVWRFCVPAALGYGAKGAGTIPPNSDLVFQVELLDSKSQREVEDLAARQAAEQAGDTSAAPAPKP